MFDSDFDAFADAFSLAWEATGKKITPEMLMFFYRILIGYQLTDITGALIAHSLDPDVGSYPPKPADVVRQIQGSKQSRALIAWTRVDKAIRQVGTYMSVVFDDPIIHAVLSDMGGWLDLGKKSEKEWPFVAREFEKRYQGYAQLPALTEYPRWLTGRFEAANSVEGHQTQPPVLIGDPIKAQMVFEGGTEGGGLQLTSAAKYLDYLRQNNA